MDELRLHDIEETACINQGLIVAIIRALDSETRERLFKNLRNTIEKSKNQRSLNTVSSIRLQTVEELLDRLESQHHTGDSF